MGQITAVHGGEAISDDRQVSGPHGDHTEVTTTMQRNTRRIIAAVAVIALLAGHSAVDAHFTSPPFAQREKKDPHVRTIMLSDDVMGGSTTFTMVSTTTKFREQNPRIYGAVLKAIEEAPRDRNLVLIVKQFQVWKNVRISQNAHQVVKILFEEYVGSLGHSLSF